METSEKLRPIDTVSLFPDEIRVLPQMRKTFNEETLDELAKNMLELTQLNDILVNRIYVDEIPVYELIAGERRLRAASRMEVRFALKAKVYDDISKFDFLRLQAAENLHERPIPQEEAEALKYMWDFAQNDEELSGIKLSQFCKLIGRNSDAVRNAIKFVESLDPRVQDLVRLKCLSYSSALAIARFDEHQDQITFAMKAVNWRWSAAKTTKVVKEELQRREIGQEELFLLDEGKSSEELRVAIANTARKEAEVAFAYFTSLVSLLDLGLLSKQVFLPKDLELINNFLDVRKHLGEHLDFSGERVKLLNP